MKKILALLLLVSAVVGMTMPAMANPTIEKIVTNEQTASNWASSEIKQELENSGDLVNTNDQIALGGDAEAASEAVGNAKAKDESNHENGNAGDDGGDSFDISGASNDYSGNALSGASAYGGNADNGDNLQINAVVQVAFAEISTTQEIAQAIDEVETLELTIEDSAIVEGNGVSDEAAIVASGDDEAEIEL